MNDPIPHDLLQAYFAGTADAEQTLALSAWVEASPEHAQYLSSLGWLDQALHQQLKHQAVDQLSEAERDFLERINPDAWELILASALSTETPAEQPQIEPEPEAEQPTPEPAHAPTLNEISSVAGYLFTQALHSKVVVLSAIAAVLLLGTLLYVSIVGLGGQPVPKEVAVAAPDQPQVRPVAPIAPAVATLTASHNAKWAGLASSVPAVGDPLHSGQRLTLTAGYAEITTARGAVAILQAPATIQLTDNNNTIRLHTGRLVGLCHTESSKGFVVRTPHMDITDLGTEFGVHASRSTTEATVFVGEIAIQSPSIPTHVITHSQTARVTLDTGTPTLVVEDKPVSGYARRLPRPALITDAAINLPGFAVEVVPNGVYEDARLYTDREHQLNGIDAAGLPSFLIGGDLVRMPAEARILKTPEARQLQLDIELSEPVDIYLLLPIDENEPVHEWVTRDYTPTDIIVGVDFGNIPDFPITHTTAVGPGESVDQTCRVWKYKHVAQGRVTVAGSMKTGMYTVIAVPTTRSNP